MIKTFREIRDLDELVEGMYRSNPKLKDSKFGYAYKRFYDKNLTPTFRNFRDELQDLRIDMALEDPNTKEIVYDKTDPVRGFKYSKDNFKKLVKLERELSDKYNDTEIDCTPYISTSVPKDLSEEQFDTLKGLIVPEDYIVVEPKEDAAENKVS